MARRLILALAALGALALTSCDQGGGRAPCPAGKLCLEYGNGAESLSIDPARASLFDKATEKRL